MRRTARRAKPQCRGCQPRMRACANPCQLLVPVVCAGGVCVCAVLRAAAALRSPLPDNPKTLAAGDAGWRPARRRAIAVCEQVYGSEATDTYADAVDGLASSLGLAGHYDEAAVAYRHAAPPAPALAHAPALAFAR